MSISPSRSKRFRNFWAATPLITLPTPLFSLNGTNPSPGSIPQALANHVANLLTALVIPIAVAGIIYSAYILITSQGNPDAYKKVKQNITYLLTGIAVILFASYLFNFVASFFR